MGSRRLEEIASFAIDLGFDGMKCFAQIMTLVFLGCKTLHAETIVLSSEMNGVEIYRGALTWIGQAQGALSDPCKHDPDCTHLTDKLITLRNGFGGPVRGQESLYLRKKVFNPLTEPITAILTLEWATIDAFELLLISGDQTQRYHANSLIPIKDRAFQSRYLNAIVTFPPGESILLARNNTINFHKGLLRLWDQTSLEAYLLKERLLLWLLYGVLVAMILSYLSIFLSSKDQSFFWPAFSLLFLMIFDLHYRSYYMEFLNALGSDLTYRPFKVMIASSLFATAGLCMVMISLDSIKVFSKLFHWIVYSIFTFILASIPVTLFLPYQFAIKLVIFFGLLTIPIAIYQIISATMKGVIPYYFILSTGIPIAAGFITFMSQLLGYSEVNLFNDLALVLGFALMALTLGLNLGRKTLAMTQERQQSIINQQAMRDSLEVAKVVQQSLLPYKTFADYSTYHFYKPAETVGGDSFYYERYENLLITAIFDVTGHGISSAIMTGTIAGAMNQSFLYEAKLRLSSTDQLLIQIATSLNETILDYNRDAKGHLVTMACGIIDTESSVLYYLNAGHIPSYLVRHNEVITLTCQGSPLGLRTDPIFSIKEWRLEADDKILYLTDGILDNLTEDGGSFRDKSILKKLHAFGDVSPEDMGEKFEDLIESKILGKSLSDDMTFLIIGKKPRLVDRFNQDKDPALHRKKMVKNVS